MYLIGYARTSTTDQEAGFEAQRRDLEAAGCKKVFAEQTSAVGARPQLEALLAFLREGDVLVVTKLDRLARSMRHLLDIVAQVEAKGASLRILSMSLDTSSATGKLVLQMFGAVAEWERSTMLERQREGIAKAKADGKYNGRAPTALRKAAEVRALAQQGKGMTEIARELDIGRTVGVAHPATVRAA